MNANRMRIRNPAPHRILVVEDTALVSEMVQGLLKELGYEVVGTATNGKEAIAQTKALRPDVVVMDIEMPVMDGIEATRRIQECCPTPVVMLTAYEQPELVRRAGEAGAGAYVVKPPIARELGRAIAIAKARFDDLNALRRLNAQLQEEIAERRRAEQALAAERTLLRTLIDSLPDLIEVKDTAGRFILANKALAEFYGLSAPEEMIGKTESDLVPSDMAERFHASDEEVLRRGVPLINRIEHVTSADGSERWILVTKVPLRDPDGETIGLVGIARDVTRWRQAEAQLRKLSRAVEQSANSIVITDLEGRIEYVNPKFERLTGYTLDEVRGQNPRVLKSGEQGPEYYRDLWRTILAGKEWYGEMHNRRKDGTLYWEYATIAPIFDENGQMTHFVAIKEDITARKEAEEALQRRNRELTALNTITQAVSSTLSLKDVLHQALKATAAALGFAGGIIAMADEQSGELCIMEHINLPPALITCVESSDVEGTLCDLAYRAEHPIGLGDLADSAAPDAHRLLEAGMRSYVGVPIVHKGTTLGAFCLFDETPRPITEADFRLLTAIGQQIGVAMDNARYTEALAREKQKSDALLLNILPASVARDLKETGHTSPRVFEHVTVFFSDIVGFTAISSRHSPEFIIGELNDLFTAFDDIMERNHCERIKTIGDAYMAVCGLPEEDEHHAENIVRAALQIIAYLRERNEQSEVKWEVRIGVHSGKVVGGVVGVKKYIYDVFGDAVNTAARMESHSEPMRINVSEATYRLTRDKFYFTERGEVAVKGKGQVKMYFVEGEKEADR